MSSPSSWELMKQCPLYQRHCAELEQVHGDNGIFGQKGRWKMVIPFGARIVYRKRLDISARYQGVGYVVDCSTGNQHTLNAWCGFQLSRRQSPPMLPYNRGKMQISAPQNCNVVMESDGQQYCVRLKLFDYIHMEKLVELGKASFDLSPMIASAAAAGVVTAPRMYGDDDNDPIVEEGLVDQFEDELGSSETADFTVSSSLSPLSPQYPQQNSTPPIQQHQTLSLVPSPPQQKLPLSTPPQQKLPLSTPPLARQQLTPPQQQASSAPPVCISPVPYSVAYGVGMAKDFKGRAYLHTLWNAFYRRSTDQCIMCGTKEITFGHSDVHASHVNARSNAGANDKTYNRIIACINCNGLGGNAHLFDQLCYAGRQCQIVPICDILLRLYCESECHVNYTFQSRRDFVERVYGTEPRVMGGIKSADVFKVLDAYDTYRPLSEYARNPLFYSLHQQPRITHHPTPLDPVNLPPLKKRKGPGE